MLSERLKNLTPYIPGEQPEDKKYIKLNTNENPFPPSPDAREILTNFDIDKLRRYPDPSCRKLRVKIAELNKIDEGNIFVGNGSDEILSLSFFSFFGKEAGNLFFPEFTYSFYPVYCCYYNIPYKKIGLNRDFSITMDPYLENESGGIIIPNPNAPTGIELPYKKIETLLEKYNRNRVVIIDEAYIDFGAASALSLTGKYRNLLIIRTLSKGYSLAGLRLGYAMGNKTLINALSIARDSFNSYPVDTISQEIAYSALASQDYYRKIHRRIISIRENFQQNLVDNGFSILPSKANFVFCRKKGFKGVEIYNFLRESGILVRHFDIQGIEDYIRISIGEENEMDLVISRLREL